MAKAIVQVTQVGIADGNVCRVRYDLVIDQGGYQFNSLETTVSISSSTTQINNSIKNKVVQDAQAMAAVILSNTDIVIFGGAQ
jgi:hypothetical protein